MGFTLFSTVTLKVIKYGVNYLKMWYGHVYKKKGLVSYGINHSDSQFFFQEIVKGQWSQRTDAC